MRRTAFAIVLAFAAGCGSSPSTPKAPDPYVVAAPTPEQLREIAGQLKMQGPPRDDVREVPLAFTDKDGKPVDLAAYRGKKSVVLVVVKGLPQKTAYGYPNPGRAYCPGCLAQLNVLTANYDEFRKRNAEVVIVFPGPQDTLPGFLSEARVDGKAPNPAVPFPLVSDADLSAVRKFGITGDLARPATYILDPGGDVVFAYVAGNDATYDRPSVKDMLEKLDKLNRDK
jgi:peroxiredoxin